ncbi:MAG: ATP-binding protein [Planctomycetota bacterium]
MLARALLLDDDAEGAARAFRFSGRHFKAAGNESNYVNSIIASCTSLVDRSLPIVDSTPFMEMIGTADIEFHPSNLTGIVRVLEAIDQAVLAADWRSKIPAKIKERARSEHEQVVLAAEESYELELARRELVEEVKARRATAQSNRAFFLAAVALLVFSFLVLYLVASRRALTRLEGEVRSREAAQDRSEELTQQLLQTQKLDALGTLSAGIAHDFNNTLQAIIIFADIVKGGMTPGSDEFEHMETIQKAAGEGRDLTRGMLVFGGQHEATKSTADLIELVEDTGSMVRHMLPASISIESVLPEARGAAWVHVNESQIKQVILNLALNARDAMPDGGELSIEVSGMEDSSDQLQLSVSDSGVGMPREVQTRIFEPFFTTKGRGKGTGLGMSMVHGIIDDHGGSIEVDSEPGAGSTIRVFLPKAIAESEETMQLDEFLIPTNGGQILLTDDDELTRSGLAETLKRAGFQVREAANGLEALDVYEEMPAAPDVILMDIDLPGLDGERCVEALRKRGATAPAIFMTGLSNHKVDGRVLTKPFSSDALLLAILDARESSGCDASAS